MVVFGLGNPGKVYNGSRHNTGRETVEKFAEKKGIVLKKRRLLSCIRGEKDGLLLVLPETFMNLSGKALRGNTRKGDDLVVVVDQADLPVGKVRVKKGGSSAGHNGLKSIISVYGAEFIRIYIGIGKSEDGLAMEKWVLGRFTESERILIDRAEEIAIEALTLLSEGESVESVARYTNRG